jgi:hypothetical protein
MYEDGPDGLPVVTGLRMSRAGQERIVKADAYVAALDVPGAKKLIPQVLPAAGPLQNLGIPILACTAALDECAGGQEAQPPGAAGSSLRRPEVKS